MFSQSEFGVIHESLKPAPCSHFSLQETEVEYHCNCGAVESSLQKSFLTVPKWVLSSITVAQSNKQLPSFCPHSWTHGLTIIPPPLFRQQCADPPAATIHIHLPFHAEEREQAHQFVQRACGESGFRGRQKGVDDVVLKKKKSFTDFTAFKQKQIRC